MGLDVARTGDQSDALLDVVAPGRKLLTRGTKDTVCPVPRERPMPHPRLVAKDLSKQCLPSKRIARKRSIVEEQEVAPEMLRVARGPDN
jgi:hypothetical protein